MRKDIMLWELHLCHPCLQHSFVQEFVLFEEVNFTQLVSFLCKLTIPKMCHSVMPPTSTPSLSHARLATHKLVHCKSFCYMQGTYNTNAHSNEACERNSYEYEEEHIRNNLIKVGLDATKLKTVRCCRSLLVSVWQDRHSSRQSQRGGPPVPHPSLLLCEGEYI